MRQRIPHSVIIEFLGDEHADGFETRKYRVHDTDAIERSPHPDDVPRAEIKNVHSFLRGPRDELLVRLVDNEMFILPNVKVISMIPRPRPGQLTSCDPSHDTDEEEA